MKKILFLFIFFFSVNASVFAEEYLPEFAGEKPKVNFELIEDDLTKNLKTQKPSTNQTYFFEDELLQNIPQNKIQKPQPTMVEDFSTLQKIHIPIRITKFITSKTSQNGDVVTFETTEKVQINNRIFAKGEKLTATVEYSLPAQLRGECGTLVIENFKFEKFDKIKLDGKISIQGAKRNFWLIPTAKIINAITIIGGYPLYFIKGGNAKIKPSKVFELYIWEKI